MNRVEIRTKYANILYLVLYIFFAVYITLISRIPSLTHTVRAIPLWSYIDWLKGNWHRGLSIILNIGLFVPIGFLFARLKPQKIYDKKWKKWALIFVIIITIAIEIAQFELYLGYFDVDDIFSNFLGGSIGIWICDCCNGQRWTKYMPFVMLLAGLIGCFITTTNTVIYETQFDFQIMNIGVAGNRLELNGTCMVYDRGDLPYQIFIDGPDGQQKAETEINGDQFMASVERTDGELFVKFQGYKPISTNSYIADGKIAYTLPDISKPKVTDTDLDLILKSATLKVYNPDYDAYVYQIENHLYWLIGVDFDASLIYHLYTTEPEKLPKNRRQFGFDNRGFKIGSEKDITKKMECGHYHVFTDIIPTDYYITAIAVGMNKGSDVLWKEYFRINRFEP